MKHRIPALCLTLALLGAALSGCGVLNRSSGAPTVYAPAPSVVGGSGTALPDPFPACTANPALAEQLRAAVAAQEDAHVRGYALETVQACLDELLEAPDLFWYAGYELTATTLLTTTVDVRFHWLYDDGPARYDALCAAADEALAAAPADDYAAALYLYDWLQARVTYEAREGVDQTAYAAICEGRAVCGGIADAYAFLLDRAGIPARTVTGVAAANDGGTEGHAWNLAVLDGAAYYFDPTWDNHDRYDAQGREYLSHDWFAVTSAEIGAAHTASDPADTVQTAANAANYYVREGYMLTEDGTGAVEALLRPQLERGSNVLTFRCADQAVYDAAVFRLFELKEAADVLRGLGLGSWSRVEWTYSTDDRMGTVMFYL